MSLFKILRGDSSRISTSTTPFRDGWAYFTPDDSGFYIDAATDDGNKRLRINPKAKNVACTLSGTGWSGNTQTVTVAGLGANSNGSADLAMDISTAALTAATKARMRVTGQAEGQITVTAYGTVPTVDIPIVVKVEP